MKFRLLFKYSLFTDLNDTSQPKKKSLIRLKS